MPHFRLAPKAVFVHRPKTKEARPSFRFPSFHFSFLCAALDGGGNFNAELDHNRVGVEFTFFESSHNQFAGGECRRGRRRYLGVVVHQILLETSMRETRLTVPYLCLPNLDVLSADQQRRKYSSCMSIALALCSTHILLSPSYPSFPRLSLRQYEWAAPVTIG